MEQGFVVMTDCGYATYRGRSVGDGSTTGGTFLIREGGFQRLPDRDRLSVTPHERQDNSGELRGFDVVNFSADELHLDITIDRLGDAIRERILERTVPISPEQQYHVPVVTEVAGTYETRIAFGERDSVDFKWVNPASERDSRTASARAFGIFTLPDGRTHEHVFDH